MRDTRARGPAEGASSGCGAQAREARGSRDLERRATEEGDEDVERMPRRINVCSVCFPA